MALRTSDDERSKIDDNYSKGSGSYLSEAERTAMDGIEDNYDQNADPSQEDDNIQRTRNKESSPSWKTNINTIKGAEGKIKGKAGSFLKKRGALLGAGVLGIGVIVIAVVVLGPAVLLPAIASNMIAKNDTSSRLFQARFPSAFRGMIETDEGTCPNASKSFRCKSSRVSNQLLSDLADRGVIAEGVDQDGVKSKKGYPSSRPTSYTVNIPGGSPQTGVAAKDLIGVINEHSRLKANILGNRGLLTSNKIWGGKHIGNMFFKPNNLDRTSTLSKLANDTKLGRKITLADFREKMATRYKSIPGFTSAPNVSEGTTKKINDVTNKVKKGGVAYLIAAGSCIISKAPSFIAAGIAAAQVAQVMPVVQEMILAPEGRMRAAGSEESAAAFTSSEAEMIGSVLTEKVAREGDGKLTSATDSKYLQYAMGINTANVPPSELSPGFSVLHNGPMRAALEAEEIASPVCDVILSEPAIYTAMAADLAVTGVTAFFSGGLSAVASAGGRVIGTYAIVSTATLALAPMVSALVADTFTNLAEDIPEARGEKLGDILGVSALTFFGAGNLANMSTVLRESDIAAMNASIGKLEDEERENDIALLSPLDASSKHTFLGSVVNSIQTTAIANNATSFSITGSVKSIFNTSFAALSGKQVKADTSTKCYGKEFGLTGDNPTCVNAAGLPVSFQTEIQANMSTQEALELIDESGWIDTEVEVADDASLEEMVSAGYIKKDTLLSSWIETCGKNIVTSGDYIMSSDGCAATPSSATAPSGGSATPPTAATETSSDEENNALTEDATPIESSVNTTADERTIQAITPALVTFISSQTVNGNNEEDFAAAPASGGGTISGDSKQLAKMIIDSGNVTGWDGDNGAGGIGIMDQLKANADGTASPDCVLSPKLLKVLAGLSKNHVMRLSDLSRNCANSNLSHSAGGHWDRPATAVDFDMVDGDEYPENNVALINELLSYVDSGENVIIGQVQTRGAGKLSPPPGVTINEFNDYPGHLHIGIKSW